jgi:hypothetical protein
MSTGFGPDPGETSKLKRDVAVARRRISDMTRRMLTSATLAAVAALLVAISASASCIASSPAELRARADVILDGKALEGPTATGIQRFRVIRYLKGRGPSIVRVQTGNVRRSDGSGSTTSVSIVVKRGERWRIFARGSARKVLQTSQCDGSRRR